MLIYVDADGFPRAAKDILIRTALRLGVSVVFVANPSAKTRRPSFRAFSSPGGRTSPMTESRGWQSREIW
jgi:uncharacterized protein YaiI (UPF0178 family)